MRHPNTKKCRPAFLGVCLIALLVSSLRAQAPEALPPEDPVHNELRALRDAAVAAYNNGDMEGVLNYVRDNVVFTPLNAEVCHGKDQLRAYYDKMMKGPNPIVRSVSADLTVDEIAELYGGNTAIAWGSIVETFELSSGLSFTSNDRWSATLIKENDRWLIANLHVSCNIFDNPLLNTAKRTGIISALVAGIVGLIVGFVIARLMKRRSNTAPLQSPTQEKLH